MDLQKRNLARKKAEKEKAATIRYLKKKEKKKGKQNHLQKNLERSNPMQKKLDECVNVLI